MGRGAGEHVPLGSRLIEIDGFPRFFLADLIQEIPDTLCDLLLCANELHTSLVGVWHWLTEDLDTSPSFGSQLLDLRPSSADDGPHEGLGDQDLYLER
jgi:hypothetical protein